MTKWEYCAIKSDAGLKYFSPSAEHTTEESNDIHQTIAQLGLDGWELVGLTQIAPSNAVVYYFKRPAG